MEAMGEREKKREFFVFVLRLYSISKILKNKKQNKEKHEQLSLSD